MTDLEKTFPKGFIRRMKLQLGEEYTDFFASLSENPSNSLRINPLKPSNSFENEEAIPWCSDGHYLAKRPEYVFDPLIHAGAYYVQDASSMLFSSFIDYSKDLRVIDLCAAPGGKSTLLLSKISKESILVSNELVRKRANVLYENLVKWGNSNVLAISNSVNDLSVLNGYFDAVVIDAPCSGEGLFRKDHKYVSEWADNKAFVCSIAQKDILDKGILLAKHGGLLIYMTCTFAEEENEQIVQWFYTKYQEILTPVSTKLPDAWGVVLKEVLHGNNTKQLVYKCYPHKVRGEGFFIAVFQVNSGLSSGIDKKTKPIDMFKEPSNDIKIQVKKFLKPNQEIQIKQYKEQIYALPAKYISLAGVCMSRLNFIKAGTLIGTINQHDNELIPTHELALSLLLKPEIAHVELSKENALNYLKKQDLQGINADSISKGWILAKYKEVNLGWLKNNGKRFNNFYPKDWVIRKPLH